jgi:hypothetical protein
MKKKNLFITAAALLALLFVAGCPQETDDPNGGSPGTPDVLVSAISIGGVAVDPLPAPAASVGEAEAGSVVINTERPPSGDETPDNVYYKPVQPVTVTLADVHETVFFAVSSPDETPPEINLPGVPDAANAAVVTRNIGVTLPDADSYPAGQIVWIKVVAADESKTEYYKIAVTSDTHDTAITSASVNGNDVLNPNQSGHIGPWLGGATWATATEGLVNIPNAQASAVSAAITLRNTRARAEYAKAAADATEPASWASTAPAEFANGDILAVRVTASNGKTAAYLKITVKIGGSAFLAGLKVNNNDIALGTPSADIAAAGGAYRVEDGKTLTSSGVGWEVSATPVDSGADVSWALAAKGATPQANDFVKTTPSFDTSHNYLYIKVVSVSKESTMYYLVIYDERPKDTEHIKTGVKSVPIYKFTIPGEKTWADLGEHPVIKMKMLMEQAEFDQADGYQRHFVFGELQRCNTSWDATNFYYPMSGSGFNVYMPFLINKQSRALAVDPATNIPDSTLAAPGIWFTVLYELTDRPDDKTPWDSNANYESQNAYNVESYYPLAETTGDVYFGIGITHDAAREYWVKELSIESEDGSFKIFCDLLGGGRIDSTSGTVGFVHVGNGVVEGGLTREMVSDPTLK